MSQTAGLIPPSPSSLSVVPLLILIQIPSASSLHPVLATVWACKQLRSRKQISGGTSTFTLTPATLLFILPDRPHGQHSSPSPLYPLNPFSHPQVPPPPPPSNLHFTFKLHIVTARAFIVKSLMKLGWCGRKSYHEESAAASRTDICSSPIGFLDLTWVEGEIRG